MQFEEFIQKLVDNEIIYKDSKELSVSWYLGGTSGNCWDDEISYSEPNNPEPFNELTCTLELLCPKLLFTEYNQLFKALVKSSREYEGDCYGGSTATQYLICDLQKLYDYLIINKLITDEKES